MADRPDLLTGAVELAGAAENAGVAAADWHLGTRQRLRQGHLDPEGLRRPGAAPVVLLPGVWGPWESTWSWGEALHAAGYDVRFVPRMTYELGDLPGLAATLREEASQQGFEGAVVVAHSKGGLVGKQALVDYPGLFRGLVACGTPFGGAPLARWAPFISRMRNLRPEDRQIRRLGKHTAVNQRIASIQAAWDQNVPMTGFLPGAFCAVVPVRGHNLLLDEPAVAQRIVQFANYFSNH